MSNGYTSGVILCGGTGSRTAPLNRITNKHMLPVGSKPMMQWNVEKLVDAGVTRILIITGKEHLGDIVSYFGSGSEFGCEFTYKVQDEAGGIAQALRLVDGFLDRNELFWVILGDNIFNFNLSDYRFIRHVPPHLQLYTKSVHDPQRFGVYHDGQIIEKPKTPKSDQAVLGVYGYCYNQLFQGILGELEKSDRGEIEVTDLNNRLLTEEIKTRVTQVDNTSDWSDAGTLESYKKVNQWDWVWK